MFSDTGFCTAKAKGVSYWRTVQCVQANIKSRIGVGQPVIVHFFAKMDPIDHQAPIEYDYNGLGNDKDLIRHDKHKYCLKQCYKMCYYISKLYHYEVLRMRCEFAKDDNNTIWFQFASDIWVRPNTTAKMAMESQFAAIKQQTAKQKEKHIKEMESNTEAKNPKQVKLLQDEMSS